MIEIKVHSLNDEIKDISKSFDSKLAIYDYTGKAQQIIISAWTYDGKDWKSEEIVHGENLSDKGNIAIDIGRKERNNFYMVYLIWE